MYKTIQKVFCNTFISIFWRFRKTNNVASPGLLSVGGQLKRTLFLEAGLFSQSQIPLLISIQAIRG